MSGVGQLGKYPILDVRSDAATALSRCTAALQILDAVIARDGIRGDPNEAKVYLEAVARNVKSALHTITAFQSY